MPPTAAKGARIEARVSKHQRELFTRAAASQGRTLSDFVVTAVQEKAEAILREQSQIQLTQADREVFFEALLNPPAPGRALRRAHKRYKGGA